MFQYCIILLLLLTMAATWSFDEHDAKIDICKGPLDVGRCRKGRWLWHYVMEKNSCKRSYMSICGNNGNRFVSRKECEEYCKTR